MCQKQTYFSLFVDNWSLARVLLWNIHSNVAARKQKTCLNVWGAFYFEWRATTCVNSVELKLHFPSVRNSSFVNTKMSDARCDYHSIFLLLFTCTKRQLYALGYCMFVETKRLHFTKRAFKWRVRLSFWTRFTCVKNKFFHLDFERALVEIRFSWDSISFQKEKRKIKINTFQEFKCKWNEESSNFRDLNK